MKKGHTILAIAMVLCSVILIGVVNADSAEEYQYQYNDDKTILTVTCGDKSLIEYRYYKGIETAKDTGKPILFCLHSSASWLYHHDEMNKIVNNDFIYIASVPKDIIDQGSVEEYACDIECSIPLGMQFYEDPYGKIMACDFLILDSNGREITRTIYSPDEGLVQMDSDGNKIASLNTSTMTTEEYVNFILETLEYSKTKKGKRLILPQEKGLISIKDLSKTDDSFNFFTVSGTIRDIDYTKNNCYNFNIDDGTGVINIDYAGGIGDIKEGDKVFVSGLGARLSSTEITLSCTSISKTRIDTGTTKSGDHAPISKTSGFGAMFTTIGLLMVAYLLRR